MSEEKVLAFNYIDDKGEKKSFPVSDMNDLQKSFFIRLSEKIKEKNKLKLKLDDTLILEQIFTERLKQSLGIDNGEDKT